MSQRVSRLSAQPVDRPTLAPDWLIALLTCMVAGGLWLLYPRQALERRLAETAETPLSVAYLHNLLRSDPQNPQLRLLLARHQILHDEMEQARSTLEPALASSNPAIHQDALWALWELKHTQYLRTPEADKEARQAQLTVLRNMLETLADEDWPADRQRRLQALTAQFGDDAQRAQLLQEQAQTQPQQATATYDRAAREALAAGDYAGSAQLFMLARSTSTDAAQARAYFHEALRTLRSGNQAAAALELAERDIGDLAQDPDTLFLLIELARAAGRPAVADRYARRLLHMSLWQPWHNAAPEQQARTSTTPYDDGASLLVRQMQTVALRSPAPKTPQLPFDDKTYSLGYQVFLENGKPEDAWAVAQAAVQHEPNNLVWRERLARVSEWTQRPALALEHWLAVARQTNNDQAWQAVLRLAPGLFDDDALALALQHQLRRKPGHFPLVQALVQTYERQGEPAAALRFLQAQPPSPAVLELLAQLAERAGQPAVALQAWRRLFAQPAHITPARAMPAAVLALLQGQPDEGLQWLEAAQKHLSPQDDASDFWRLTGQIAESRQHREQAIAAYRQLSALPQAELEDMDALIRQLLPSYPLEAAQVALHAWQQHDQPRHLIQALTLYSSRGEWAPFDRVLTQLDPSPEAKRHSLQQLRRLPEYLRLMGSHHQNAGRLALAREHLQTGLALSPDSTDMQTALLWLLIDSNDAASLRELLTHHEEPWSRQPAMHDALASSYQALSQPQVALERYLTPQLPARQNDFLWLMNYADALDQNQQFERAWQLRRHLLRQQREQLTKGRQSTPAQLRQQWLTEQGLDATRRVARTRLVLSNNPGDPAYAMLRELLRLDLDSAQQLTNAAAEVAIGWLQDQGEYTAERRFLWQQYARSRSLRTNRPLWAEITVALAEDDKAATGQLLDEFDERLPRYDRVNAAAAVDDIRRAQSAAFETQEAQSDDNPLHLQLTENLLAFSDHAALRAQRSQLEAIDENQTEATLHLALSPRLSLDLLLTSVHRQVTVPLALRHAPDERIAALQLRWRQRDGVTLVRATSRQGYHSTTPLYIEHEQRLDQRLSLRGELGWQLPSEESLALRLGGMKTRVAAHLRYQPTRLDQVQLSQWGEQYRLQTGAEVGRARHTAIEYTHNYRLDAPLVDLGAFWSSHRFERRHPYYLGQEGQDFQQHFVPANQGDLGLDYFLPRRFSFYGLRLSTNMRYAQDYTRALRPFASISRSWHSELGPGYELQLGMAGNVLGPDHLRLGLVLSKSGVQSLGLTRQLELTYRLHF